MYSLSLCNNAIKKKTISFPNQNIAVTLHDLQRLHLSNIHHKSPNQSSTSKPPFISTQTPTFHFTFSNHQTSDSYHFPITMNDLMTKSFTSYVDLKKTAMKDLDLEAGPDHHLEMQTTQQPDHNLTLFLQEAELVKQEMNSIRQTLIQLESANQESKTLHNVEVLKANRRRINGDIVAVLKKAKTIKSSLEEMDRKNVESRRLSGCKMGTPVDRTRSAVTNGLRKKLKELMMDFQELRQRMMSEYKETVGRRYFTVTGEEANEEVIDKIINSGSDGQGGEEFMSKAIQVCFNLTTNLVHESKCGL